MSLTKRGVVISVGMFLDRNVNKVVQNIVNNNVKKDDQQIGVSQCEKTRVFYNGDKILCMNTMLNKECSEIAGIDENKESKETMQIDQLQINKKEKHSRDDPWSVSNKRIKKSNVNYERLVEKLNQRASMLRYNEGSFKS